MRREGGVVRTERKPKKAAISSVLTKENKSMKGNLFFSFFARVKPTTKQQQPKGARARTSALDSLCPLSCQFIKRRRKNTYGKYNDAHNSRIGNRISRKSWQWLNHTYAGECVYARVECNMDPAAHSSSIMKSIYALLSGTIKVYYIPRRRRSSRQSRTWIGKCSDAVLQPAFHFMLFDSALKWAAKRSEI